MTIGALEPNSPAYEGAALVHVIKSCKVICIFLTNVSAAECDFLFKNWDIEEKDIWNDGFHN